MVATLTSFFLHIHNYMKLLIKDYFVTSMKMSNIDVCAYIFLQDIPSYFPNRDEWIHQGESLMPSIVVCFTYKEQVFKYAKRKNLIPSMESSR
jgi:hypothetical protein